MKSQIKAVLGFIRVLLKPMDPIAQECQRGHSVLVGWDFCPDCDWINRENEESLSKKKLPIHGILFGIGQIHEGEMFLIREKQETLGLDVSCSQVFTPKIEPSHASYLLVNEGVRQSISSQNLPFQMNGRDSWKENLIDYDEICLFGSRFLFLEVRI
jgi:hypothetical protein